MSLFRLKRDRSLNHQDSDNTPIPIRHMDFHFDEKSMSKYCWDDNAFGSAFILTFSFLIPAGERLVIETMRAYRHKIRDPELKARVTGLIGQEAMHSKVHEEFNQVYKSKGIPVDRISAAGEWFFQKHLPRILPLPAQLAVTCAIEHFTAMMAERAFNEIELNEKLDEGAREFLLWHLLEETEHKSVAFDVYLDQVGNERLRKWALRFIVAYTVPLFTFSIQQILSTPGYVQNLNKTREGFAYWFGPRQGYLATLQPSMNKYFRSDYHPNMIKTDEILAEWGEKMFGTGGIVTDKITKTIEPKLSESAGTA